MNKGRECGYAPIDRHNPVRPTLATHWLLFFLLQCDEVTMYRRQRPDPTRTNPAVRRDIAVRRGVLCAKAGQCAGDAVRQGRAMRGGCCAPRRGGAPILEPLAAVLRCDKWEEPAEEEQQ